MYLNWFFTMILCGSTCARSFLLSPPPSLNIIHLDIPAGVDEMPEDPTYLPIIGSGPASNPAASLPGPSAVVAASKPKYVHVFSSNSALRPLSRCSHRYRRPLPIMSVSFTVGPPHTIVRVPLQRRDLPLPWKKTTRC